MKTVFILRSNPVAPDPRVEKVCHALSKSGYNVKVIAWDRSGTYPKYEKKEFGEIVRIKIKSGYGKGIKNILNFIKWQFFLIIFLLKNKYDIVHCCDFDTIVPGYLISKKVKRAKVVYDIFDFYADMLRNTPSILIKLIRWLDLHLINCVDAVILADESRKKQIRKTRPKELKIIYNTPLDIYQEKQVITKEENEFFRICYIGILQIERGLLEMIDVVSKHPKWVLDIAGYGGDADRILDEIKKHKNIRYHGILDYDTSLRLSEKATVLFAIYDPRVPNHKYACPNKLFEAMMLGKPIIVSDDTTMSKIVKEVKNGIVIPYGDKNALENALITLSENLQLREMLGRNSRKAYKSKYNWRRMEEELISLYRNL